MITNMAETDFVDNFLKYCWDTRDTETGFKTLHDLSTYGPTYGENPIDAFTSFIPGNGREVGPWKGGPLLGETQFDEVGSTCTTKFFNCALEGLYFTLGGSFLRPLDENTNLQGACFIIGGMNNNSEYGNINMTFFSIKNCDAFYFKNVTYTGHFSPIVFEEQGTFVVFDNAVETRFFYSQDSNLFPSSNFILKPRDVSIEGGSSNARRLELSGATCLNLTLSGDATGYASSAITLSPRLEVRYLFVVLGNVFINKQVSKSLLGTNASVTSDVFASVAYFATSDVINLSGLTSRLFCKGNTGTTSIGKAEIGDFQSKGVAPTSVSGSGILLVAGTLNINHLSCYGDVLMRAGTTANLSGTIDGNLVVADGATLNAVSLTVKGNVTFEAGATITWKGGTYTGTLTDPNSYFGGAVAGAYLNV